MRKYSSWMICHLITFIAFVTVIDIATQSELLSDLTQYNSDRVLFVIYILVGIFLTQRVLKSVSSFDLLNNSLSSLYFYSAYCMFSDGHVAGWSHSADLLTEKLLMGILISLIMLITIYVPVVSLIVATVHNKVIKAVWRFANS
ncbi:MAG: hypothetical protein ACJAUY_002805 [Cognaticolwellia sp.]|jgi:hypothetical protein